MGKKKSNISRQKKENLGKIIDDLSSKLKIRKAELINIDKTNELIDKTKNRLKELDKLYERNKKFYLEGIVHNVLNNIEKCLNLTFSQKRYQNTLDNIKNNTKFLSDLKETTIANLNLNLLSIITQDSKLSREAKKNKEEINHTVLPTLKQNALYIEQQKTLLSELNDKITILEEELKAANEQIKENERDLFNHIFNIIDKLTKDINQGEIRIDIKELVNSLQNTQDEKVKNYIKNYLSDKKDLNDITSVKKEKLNIIQKLEILKEYLSNSKETQSEEIKLPDENFGEMKNELLNKLPEKLKKGLDLSNQLEIEARIIKYKKESNEISSNSIDRLIKEKEDLITRNNELDKNLNDIAIDIRDILLKINPIHDHNLNDYQYIEFENEFQTLKNEYRKLNSEKLKIKSRISEIDNEIEKHNTTKDDLKNKITTLESLLDLVNNHKSIDETGKQITIATQTAIVFNNKITPVLANS